MNGWENRETWALALHLDNDEFLQKHMQELALNLPKEELAKHIEEFIEDLFDGYDLTQELRIMIRDVGSLWRVNFQEIAKHYQ